MRRQHGCRRHARSSHILSDRRRVAALGLGGVDGKAPATLPPVFLDSFEHPFGFLDVAPEMLGHVFGGHTREADSSVLGDIEIQRPHRTLSAPVEHGFRDVVRKIGFQVAIYGAVPCTKMIERSPVYSDGAAPDFAGQIQYLGLAFDFVRELSAERALDGTVWPYGDRCVAVFAPSFGLPGARWPYSWPPHPNFR